MISATRFIYLLVSHVSAWRFREFLDLSIWVECKVASVDHTMTFQVGGRGAHIWMWCLSPHAIDFLVCLVVCHITWFLFELQPLFPELLLVVWSRDHCSLNNYKLSRSSGYRSAAHSCALTITLCAS